MSIQRIEQYQREVEKTIRYGGSSREESIRNHFWQLLDSYAQTNNLLLVTELYYTAGGDAVKPDGTLKDALRQDWGYWESKDEDDDLEREIARKFAKGYPDSNILFEDSQTAVLVQAGREVARAPFRDREALHQVLTRFVSYETAEVRAFREAIEAFTEDVPALAAELRELIREQYEDNPAYRKAAADFLELCREAINPSMDEADVREMIVQHVLTADIFITVFGDPQFHDENVIARELGGVVETFYQGRTRRRIDSKIAGYTQAIKARAAQIYDHHEKQRFLKVLYEAFYKAYNPKGADRLGIVYTPNEIVDFMIRAADDLCWRHFGRGLADKGVEILDPATGTGTFITELIEYIHPDKLAYKYENELHCNEVAILPYYIANLNIELSYKQKMGRYEPFENIVFVDTLDNIGFQDVYGRQGSLFGLTDENLERIERQNKRDISVIIGNPPYNAWQENFNMQNPNRPYKEIDQRIKDTYVKEGTAQNKIGLYDMYARFYRWASDRIGTEGIVAFITNSSFIDGRIFDGFRKVVADEFSHIYILDLGGNVRKNPKLSGPRNNVFAIQTGVAIAFMVRTADAAGPCRIQYARRPELEEAPQKLQFLAEHDFAQVPFAPIQPSSRHNWINLADNDFEDLLPVAAKEGEAIFRLFSNGLKTQRDEWVYDFSREALEQKMRFFVDTYEAARANPDYKDKMLIKWDPDMERFRQRGIRKTFEPQSIVESLYRPFVKMDLYFDAHFNGRTYQIPHMFRDGQQDLGICFRQGSRLDFYTLATEPVPNLGLFSLDPVQCVTLYRYDDQGNRVDNITDWALAQFRAQYGDETIAKEEIFHYVYAVLHNPAYREKYKLNLKRDFPRIPFYDDFRQWATWGARLMDLHINYETVDPYPLRREDADPASVRAAYKAKLSADQEAGIITLDTLTQLHDVPPAAWAYKLGNRSAVEWVLDRYKERKPRDPTIRARFNTYRFTDYKEEVIDLLGRVTAVSVATMAIIDEMAAA